MRSRARPRADWGALDPGRALVRSSMLSRPDGDPAGVQHALVQRPLRLNAEARAVLDLFATPRTPEAARRAGGVPASDVPALASLVERLVAAALLVPAGLDEGEYIAREGVALFEAAQPRFTPAAPGLFGAREVAEGEVDAVVVGVPFDRAATRQGAQAGPAAVRDASALVPCGVDPLTGALRGFADMATGRELLRGARVRDLGDVGFRYWEGLDESYARVTAAAREAAATGALAVFVGGDHSITAPILRAYEGDALFVVHFDAHSDLGPLFEGKPHHHGNVMVRVAAMEHVTGMLQVGLRDAMHAGWRPPRKVRQLGAYRATATSPAALVAMIPPRARCYLTVDVDVLDAAYAPATGTLLPGGLGLAQLEGFVEAVALRRDLVAMDLVEVAPSLAPGNVTALSALRVIARAVDASIARRGRARAPRAATRGARGRAPRRGAA